MTITCMDYLEALERRNINFRFFQAALTEKDLPSARGWDPLKEKYSKHNAADDAKYANLLSDIHWNHIMHGPRAIGIIDLSDLTDQQFSDVSDRFSRVKSQKCIFTEKFPLPIDEVDLLDVSDNYVVSVEEYEDEIRLNFCSRRKFRERVKLVEDDFDSQADKAIVGGFFEVVGYREGVAQAYDSILCRINDKRLEVHVDLSMPMNKVMIQAALNAYYRKVLAILDGVVEKSDIPGYMDIFPSIEKLYYSDEGIVVELHHMTSTGSIKKEQMRKKEDLRSELFHDAGAGALGYDIEPHAIKVVWNEYESFSHPEIEISAALLSASSDKPSVNYLKIDGCADSLAKEMLLSQIS